jgi:hypothetical protein
MIEMNARLRRVIKPAGNVAISTGFAFFDL